MIDRLNFIERKNTKASSNKDVAHQFLMIMRIIFIKLQTSHHFLSGKIDFWWVSLQNVKVTCKRCRRCWYLCLTNTTCETQVSVSIERPPCTQSQTSWRNPPVSTEVFQRLVFSLDPGIQNIIFFVMQQTLRQSLWNYLPYASILA